MDGAWGDVRLAVRTLVRSPSFTLVAVLTLALGIGANTAIFSVFDAMLLRGLPYPEPDRIVAVWLEEPGSTGTRRTSMGVADLDALRDEPDLFEALAGWRAWSPTLMGRGGAAVIRAGSVSAGMLSGVLGVQPTLGRDFTPDEHLPDGPRTVVLSHHFWQDRFSGDPGVLGRVVSLDDEPYTVVGVMPAGFRPPFAPGALVWTPSTLETAPCTDECARVDVLGRLESGLSLPVARDRLAVAARRAAETRPGVLVAGEASMGPLRDELLGDVPRDLHLLLGAFAFVLLLACTNIANLLLARGVTRDGEFAVRRALGAGRGAVLRQLLVESVVLSTLGGTLGLALAAWGTDVLAALAPEALASIATVAVDTRVLAFTVALAGLTGLAFGLVPALRAARFGTGAGPESTAPRAQDVDGSGRRRARGAARLRAGVVAGQVALTVLLLSGAVLTIGRLATLSRTDLGFDPDGVAAVTFELPASRFAAAGGSIGYYDAIVARLAQIPGVVAVGATSAEPMRPLVAPDRFVIRGEAGEAVPGTNVAYVRRVSTAFFYTVGQRLADGRTFAAGDDGTTPPVAVVNQAFAGRFFGYPLRSPLGHAVRLNGSGTWRTIVGVVEDARDVDIRASAEPTVYVPFHQDPVASMTVLVRSESGDDGLMDDLRSAVLAVDRSTAAARVTHLTTLVAGTQETDRFTARLLGFFAALALVLSTVGLYGLVTHHVTSRLREAGIRLAVGAGGDEVRRIIMRRGAVILVPGLFVGIIGALLARERLDDFWLAEGAPASALSLALALGILSVAAFLATWVPARRAATLDVAAVLRED